MRKLLSVLLVIFCGNVYAQTVIDNYSDALTVTDVSGGASTVGSVAGAGMIGGSRDVRVTAVGASSASATITGGMLTWTSDGTADLEINYDGNADDVLSSTGLGGVDLTANGKNSFEFMVSGSNTTGDFVIRVRDGSNTSEYVGNLVSPSGAIVIPFADFTGSANFSSVENIFFDLRVRDGAETFQLEMLETTPVELQYFEIN